MENYVYYGQLYDLYQGLLTDKQRNYFEDYYFQNLTLGEMAEVYCVSRNAIFKQLHNVVDKLLEYEKILHLYQKKIELSKILEIDSLSDVKNAIECLLEE